MNDLAGTILCGVGATIVMDLWGVVRKSLFGLPQPDYALVGRWFAHMSHGQFYHEAIKSAPVIRGECVIGWIAHYLTGIGFAAILIAIQGSAWLDRPTISPALILGIATVAAPFLLMQPGMGAGIAASRTPRPGSARLQSLITHAVFGLGLYVAGWVANILSLL